MLGYKKLAISARYEKTVIKQSFFFVGQACKL